MNWLIMKKGLIRFFLFLTFLLPIKGVANTDFFFSHLGVEDGLSQISVLKIFQDSDGYLWFGTRSGLNKYDGYEFNIYKNEYNNPNSLTDRYIRDINEDKHKNIWIGTTNGLNCIEYRSGKVHRFYPKDIYPSSSSNNASHILSHTDGNLYMIGGSNVFICHPGIFVTYHKHIEQLSSSIRSIAQDTLKGDIYIGTDTEGFLIFSPEWELKKQIKPGEQNLPKSFITTILPDEEGIWLGTEDYGVCFYDFSSQQIFNYNKTNSNIGNTTVRSLIYMNEDSILIGTFSGLNILDKKTRNINPVKMNMLGDGSLSHYSIHSMLLDKDQTLWIGTYSAGINYYSPYYKQITYITSERYTGIKGKGEQDKDGNLWFATEGSGLFFYNPQTHEQKLYPLKPLVDTNYERNIIKYILLSENSEEILCTTHFGSVYSFSIHDKTYKLLYDYKENDINSLYIDHKQRLWIPTMTTSYMVVVENGKEKNRFPINEKDDGYFAQITAIKEIDDHLFLLGGYRDSLYVYDWEKGESYNLTRQLPESIQKERLGTISSILCDSAYIWISSTKGGVLKYSRGLEFCRQYLPSDGLPDSYITSLVIDQQGDVWAATVNEIAKLNKQTDLFYPIKQTDVPQQEFTLHAGTASANGTVYFPASQGILAINPEKLQENPVIPPLYITSLIINNARDLINQMESPKKGSEEYAIQLRSDQDNLRIRYTALNYIHTDANQYMFRMDGVDNNWQLVGNRREAYYSNLYPGSYTFRIKASNNDGLWNPKETILHITILPPLYKSGWAYTLYTLIFLVISFQIYRYQHRKHELERDIRYKQKEQERMKELHEERLRMFNNFAHELRTPLTLITNPLEELTQNISFSRDVKQALNRMKKNTQRMLILVNNLMDVQKYEAGQSRLHKRQFNFSDFVNEIYQSFITVSEKRKVTLTLKNELPQKYLVYYDETEIEKAFFNLLSNAFKFTPSQGKVALLIRQATTNDHPEVKSDESYIYIEVKDSGEGFSQEEGLKIFEPFYQFNKDIHQEISGTGIGLSLTRSIIEMHQGIIWAQSNEESETCFMILLPDTEIQHYEETIPPLISSSETAQKTQILLNEAEALKKQTLLIADDDDEIRDYLKQELGNEYKVICTTNGKEALQIVQTTNIHIVISDIVMPKMNGVELCRQIKNSQDYSHIPVILLSAKSSVSQIEEGLDIGADDYITKPFQITILKARIRNILSVNRHKASTDEPTNILQVLGIDTEAMKDDFISQYIEIVKNNISNPELDISFIHNSLGMSRANFYRKVKTLTGLSPVELIRNIRLEVGAQLLRETDLNISEIAQKTGFASRSYFARNFKSLYGVSPTEYQENMKTSTSSSL